MSVLVSPKNPLLKDIRRAVERGGLTADGLCVAESFHLVQEALRSNCHVAAILAAESAFDQVGAIAQGVEVIRVSDAAFRTVASTETTQGVLALVEPPAHQIEDLLRTPALVVVLDGIQDPGNGGTIVRTAEAFGASGVLLLKGSVNPYNPKAIRASAGSLFRLPVISGMTADVAVEVLRNAGVALYAAMPRASRTVHQADFTKPSAIVIGSEGRGVGEQLSRAADPVRIPTTAVESLNAAIASGILLYEAARQRAI